MERGFIGPQALSSRLMQMNALLGKTQKICGTQEYKKGHQSTRFISQQHGSIPVGKALRIRLPIGNLTYLYVTMFAKLQLVCLG